MAIDTTARRESACPVHFIWDGHGLGRPFVRAGFFGFVAAGLVFTGQMALHFDAGIVPGAIVGSSAVLWVAGQLLGRLRR